MRPRKNISLLGMLTVVAASYGGQLIHKIDYEGGDFSEWRTCSECSFDGSNPRIVSSPVRSGKKAARFKSVDKRTEAASERYLDRETDLWIGWSVYVEKFASDPGRADVTQFHGYQPACKSNDPKIHVDIKNLQWGITINYYEGGQKKTISKSKLTAVRKGRWTDLVANFKLTDTKNGYFNFWVDGEKVLSFKGKTSGNCPEGHYLKAGVYNTPSGAVIYNDAFTIMKNASYSEVAPGGGTPDPEPDPSPVDTLEPNSCVTGSTTWSNYAIGTLEGTTDLRFVVSPSQGKLDAVMGLSGAPGSGYSDYGALIRLSPAGVVDVRNGDTYAADRELSYAAGDEIALRIEIDFGAKEYSVFARKNGGNEVNVARDYAFRTEQATSSSFSNLGLITGSGEVALCDYESPVPAGATRLQGPTGPAGRQGSPGSQTVGIYSPSGRLLYRGTRAAFDNAHHDRSGLILIRTGSTPCALLISGGAPLR